MLQISEKDASAKSSTSKKIGWTKGKLKQLIQSTTTVKEVGTSTSGRKRKREYKGEKRTSTRKNTNPYASITPFKRFRTKEMTKRIRSNEKLKKDQKDTKRLTPRKKTIQQKEKKLTESASTSTQRRSKRTKKTDKQSKELTVVKQPKKKKKQ